MSTKIKYYVVWEGRQPGIYDNWPDAQEQIEHWPKARYKSFSSRLEAINAFRAESSDSSEAIATLLIQAENHKKNISKNSSIISNSLPEGVDKNGIAVDASCMGNPGIMEYRAVSLQSGKEIFHMGPFKHSTNNIGEYLALVHILALCKQKNLNPTIYTDSRTALSWLRNRGSKTTLARTRENADSFNLLARADVWVKNNTWNNPIIKWDTAHWGEIPADFGRK